MALHRSYVYIPKRDSGRKERDIERAFFSIHRQRYTHSYKVIKSNDGNILVDVKRQIRETDRHVLWNIPEPMLFCVVDVAVVVGTCRVCWCTDVNVLHRPIFVVVDSSFNIIFFYTAYLSLSLSLSLFTEY